MSKIHIKNIDVDMEDLRDRLWAIITQFGIQKMAVFKDTITVESSRNDVDVFRRLQTLKNELKSSGRNITVTRDE